MATSGLYVSGKKVYQDIDAEELLGVDLSKDPLLAQSIGQAVVDFMRERTQKDSVDRNGDKFAPYSKSYKNSEDYEAAGKTSKVDMTLRGFMLNSLDFEASGSSFRFGFDDPDEEVKAYGHMTGMEGHKHLDGKTPRREFFGISNEDFVELVQRRFGEDLERLKQSDEELPEFDGLNLAGSTATGAQTMTLEDLLGGGLFDEEL